ncbi:hypothetical protein [Elizabethkingia sp. JS20170427COW]|uniref:hypothetical protein n=1 Tax=Elizabethkingia sp. JS20170427COW TaxID=2583851 RepID=UPI0021083167|nr:hypothetical protein [Elizabethkingia sp. JS20170427COW]
MSIEVFVLKKSVLLLFMIICSFCFSQQKEYWLIDAQTQKVDKVKDSISAVKFLDAFLEKGYYFTDLEKVTQEGTITKIVYNKGKNYNSGYVTISDSLAAELKLPLKFFTPDIDSTKQVIHRFYQEKGFAFNRVKAKFKGMKKEFPNVEITLLPIEKRAIDSFAIKGYERVPSRFVENLKREFVGKVYNRNTIERIRKSLQNHPYVLEERSPQTLFTKDSTTVFLYLQKKKSNTFDGVIGFGNDKTEKFKLNGSLNVSLQNMFNGFENIALFWQRNPDSGQTFDLKVDVPFVLNSNVGFQGNVNIYRQDSLFANVKLKPSFYYNFSLRQKLGVRGNIEVSSVLSDLYQTGQDYNKKGVGIWYQYLRPAEVDLFVHNTKVDVEGDFLNVLYQKENISSTQWAYRVFGEHNLHLSGNNFLNVKAEMAGISSKISLVENELLRFGGWSNLRGFNENSLIANFYAYGGAEYRYVISDQAFFDFFAQLGLMKNTFTHLKAEMYSFGTGFNYKLPFGIMSFQISSGNIFGNPVKFQDTKIHWGIISKF